MASEPPVRSGDFRAARIGAAAAFTAVLVLMLAADVALDSYSISPVVLMPVLGTILTLLGIEGLDIIRGSRR